MNSRRDDLTDRIRRLEADLASARAELNALDPPRTGLGLILTRNRGDAFYLGTGGIYALIVVETVRDRQVELRIRAPRTWPVWRAELATVSELGLRRIPRGRAPDYLAAAAVRAKLEMP